MDSFAIVLVAGLGGLLFWVWLLGRYYPGSGMEQLGLRSSREIVETQEALEAEDLEQMLSAHNARRRRRGEREVSVADLELRVAEDLRDQRRRQQEVRADRDLDGLLEATNARRRARGMPERTREQVQQEFGQDVPPGH